MNDDLVARGKALADSGKHLSPPVTVEHNGHAQTAVPGSRTQGTEPGTDAVPGSRNRTGTAVNGAVPGSLPPIPEPGTDDEKPLYVDISALLDGT
ncbi:hypothetical protein, partial [Mycobacterium alsense]